ncbi:putative MPP superfamily phosphohydrolase [Actimicrobium sp. GrIS 1.19]|uniref:metallophosphoesterase n=1 Tax=Actimicrobium sp. GrIS 1.19 TaxID=3071708 RepID=UPI002DFFA2BD|nr:putative MPP superfamily phosphohydrolase [Actimicrobium sp. GrIS 1.19]
MLSVISLLLHLYVGARLLPSLAGWPVAMVTLLAALLASAWLMPMGIGLATRFRPARPRGAAHPLILLGWLAMGLFSSLLVLTLARDVLLLAVVAVNAVRTGLTDSAALRDYSALAVWMTSLAMTVLGFVGARRTATVVRVDVPIAGLPPALQGFLIAQISDIHVGPTIRGAYLERIVAAVNAQAADMVAITGDLVDGSVAELAGQVASLAQLRSRHGSFFVTGNHEYYSGAAAWVSELRRLGVTVLMNEHVMLAHGAAQALVGGVTDFSAGHFDPLQSSDPQRAIAGAPAEAGVRILLAHQPRSATAAAAAGFDLQLSGHTHGGQFLPWNFFVRLQQPFVAGLHRLQQLWVYTSRGTGYWGPPKRFGAPSEITLLRLTAA